MDFFFGRDRELQLFKERWESREPQLVVLYGRRRVGKTELIRRFAKGKRTLFAVGTRADARSQIRHFVEEVARIAQEPDLVRLPINDWDTILNRLTAVIAKAGQKILLVLDEFPWMVESSPELPSILQKYWDSHWSRSGKVFLILCGSYFGFMEREVLAQKSPLFGRRSAVLLLKPLSFADSRPFHKSLPLKEQAKRYLLCGGIPAYHKLFRSADSLSTQLIGAFFEPDAPLAKEADFLLMEELREPKIYFSMLEAMGASRVTMTDLAGALGIEPTRIPYYTRNLIDLRYIEKLTPVLTFRDRYQKKSRYRIQDALLRFWFTFVYPHINLIERLDARAFYSTVVSQALDAYWGNAFEAMAAELFLTKKLIPRLGEPFSTGVYWDKEIQLDFVIALKSGLSYLGEVKWHSVEKASIDAYLTKLNRFKGKLSYEPVFISADEISKSVRKRADCRIYSLADLL